MPLADYQLPNSTEHGGSSGEDTVTYKYRVPEATWHSYIPNYNATKNDGDLGTVYFKSYTKRPDENDHYYLYLDLSYSTQSASSAGEPKEDNDDLYLPVSSTFEKPLESHANYLTKWNYDLYQKTTSSDAVPAWAATATDRSDATGEQWLWAKESPGDDWKLEQVKTKPGIEAWLAPAFAVRYQFWHATKSSVTAVLQTMATLQVPGETFGYSGEWLVTGVQIDEDGRRYRGTIEYTFADDWDADLYGAPPP